MFSAMRRILRRDFGRDVAFDPGGATAPRLLVGAAHVAFDDYERLGLHEFMAFGAQSHTPSDHCVRFAPAVAGNSPAHRLAAELSRPKQGSGRTFNSDGMPPIGTTSFNSRNYREAV